MKKVDCDRSRSRPEASAFEPRSLPEASLSLQQSVVVELPTHELPRLVCPPPLVPQHVQIVAVVRDALHTTQAVTVDAVFHSLGDRYPPTSRCRYAPPISGRSFCKRHSALKGGLSLTENNSTSYRAEPHHREGIALDRERRVGVGVSLLS